MLQGTRRHRYNRNSNVFPITFNQPKISNRPEKILKRLNISKNDKEKTKQNKNEKINRIGINHANFITEMFKPICIQFHVLYALPQIKIIRRNITIIIIIIMMMMKND